MSSLHDIWPASPAYMFETVLKRIETQWRRLFSVFGPGLVYVLDVHYIFS